MGVCLDSVHGTVIHESCLVCIAPHPSEPCESIISLHRLLGPVDDYAGDGLEYNISTCITERLANCIAPHPSEPCESIISLHRLLGPVDDYAGDGLEYNISTCIQEPTKIIIFFNGF